MYNVSKSRIKIREKNNNYFFFCETSLLYNSVKYANSAYKYYKDDETKAPAANSNWQILEVGNCGRRRRRRAMSPVGGIDHLTI